MGRKRRKSTYAVDPVKCPFCSSVFRNKAGLSGHLSLKDNCKQALNESGIKVDSEEFTSMTVVPFAEIPDELVVQMTSKGQKQDITEETQEVEIIPDSPESTKLPPNKTSAIIQNKQRTRTREPSYVLDQAQVSGSARNKRFGTETGKNIKFTGSLFSMAETLGAAGFGEDLNEVIQGCLEKTYTDYVRASGGKNKMETPIEYAGNERINQKNEEIEIKRREMELKRLEYEEKQLEKKFLNEDGTMKSGSSGNWMEESMKWQQWQQMQDEMRMRKQALMNGYGQGNYGQPQNQESETLRLLREDLKATKENFAAMIEKLHKDQEEDRRRKEALDRENELKSHIARLESQIGNLSQHNMKSQDEYAFKLVDMQNKNNLELARIQAEAAKSKDNILFQQLESAQAKAKEFAQNNNLSGGMESKLLKAVEKLVVTDFEKRLSGQKEDDDSGEGKMKIMEVITQAAAQILPAVAESTRNSQMRKQQQQAMMQDYAMQQKYYEEQERARQMQDSQGTYEDPEPQPEQPHPRIQEFEQQRVQQQAMQQPEPQELPTPNQIPLAGNALNEMTGSYGHDPYDEEYGDASYVDTVYNPNV